MVIAKGRNANAVAKGFRAKWDKFKHPVAVSTDAARFDQHTSVGALKFEHKHYTLFYRSLDKERLRELLSWQLNNRFYAYMDDGRFKFKTRGRRCSGDMNTGIGNSIIMASLLDQYCKLLHIESEIAVNGDDATVIMENTDVDRFIGGLSAFFNLAGYTIKQTPSTKHFEEIDFCQTRPVYDGSRWVMVRGLEALAKDCLCTLPHLTPLLYRRWLAAVGKCGKSLAGGIPIYNSFYKAMIRAADGAEPLEHPSLESGFEMLARGMRREFQEPTPAARASFYLAFGISPQDQMQMERYYDNFVKLSDNFDVNDFPIDHPLYLAKLWSRSSFVPFSRDGLGISRSG
jgi:hypothetical protein